MTSAPAPKIRILLADDHAVVCEGLRNLLGSDAQFDVVGVAHTGRAAVEMAIKLRPDVVVLDLEMPELNGIDAARMILAELPAKIIALSGFNNVNNVQRMLAAGASCFVSKDAVTDEIIHAIRAALRGERYLSPLLNDAVLRDYAARVTPEPDDPFHLLTAREREVLALIGAGCSLHDIAARLEIGTSTVHSHREKIQEKLGVSNTVDLIKLAIRYGLTSIYPSSRP